MERVPDSELRSEDSTALFHKRASDVGERPPIEGTTHAKGGETTTAVTADTLSALHGEGHLDLSSNDESWSRSSSFDEAASEQDDQTAAPLRRALEKEIADLVAFEGIDPFRKGVACTKLVEAALRLVGGSPQTDGANLRAYAETQMEQVAANLAGLIMALNPLEREVRAPGDDNVHRRVVKQFRHAEAVLAEVEAEAEGSAEADGSENVNCELRNYVHAVVAEAAADLAGLAAALVRELPSAAM